MRVLPLLALLAAPSSAARLTHWEAGFAAEDYGFASAGFQQWTLARAELSPKTGVSAGQAVVHRFDLTDPEGRLGFDARLAEKTGVETAITLSPGALVLPRVSAGGIVYQGLPAGFSLQPGYRWARYELADVHALSLGVSKSWRDLELSAKGYATDSVFRSAGSLWTPGFLGMARWTRGRMSVAPSYAYREESFQAGAPGAFRSRTFEAHTGRLEASWEPQPWARLRAAWQYESRKPANYVRQYELAVGGRF